MSAPQPLVTRVFRSLASTLIRRAIAAAAICAIVAATVQALVAVRDEHQAFDRTLRNIAETNVPLLSVSLWDIEPQAVRKQLEQVAAQPEIAYAKLTERTGHVFEGGDRGRAASATPNRLDIPYPDGRAGTIGTLEVVADPATLYRHVAQHVLEVVVGYALLATVFCILIAVALRIELERPMRALTRFTKELTPQSLTTPLTLSRPARRWHDEIDQLAHGFRTLQDGIHEHVRNLDALVASRTAQLETALDEIRELTITDPLTGCRNRRYLDERLREEVTRSSRSHRPLALIVTDIDHFKRINDTHGHAGGDQVLRGAAAILQREMRAEIDWVARMGGEEFVILLPDTTLEAAAALAERLRVAVAAAVFPVGDREVRITASFGVAARAEDDTPASFLARADAMVYRAKENERNCVVAG